jgi:hypothetical protein
MEPKNVYTKLADISRQPLKTGTPGAYLFTDSGARFDRELVHISTQLRIAEALEEQTELLKAKQIVGKQVVVSISSSKLALFKLFLAQQPDSLGVKVVAEAQASPLPIDSILGGAVDVTIQTNSINEFFYLGEGWARYQQKEVASE